MTKPASASSFAIMRSGPVSLPLIRDITRERVAASIMSPRCSRFRGMATPLSSRYSPHGVTLITRGFQRKQGRAVSGLIGGAEGAQRRQLGVELPPFAPMLMQSLRSVGYSTAAALADLVDNSIAAKA